MSIIYLHHPVPNYFCILLWMLCIHITTDSTIHIETQPSNWMLGWVKTQTSKGLYEFFLLFSSLSERAPRETKLHYAFKIYDFDQDNFIGINDIEQAVKLLTQVINFSKRDDIDDDITEPAHCRGGPKDCGKGGE